MFPARAPEAGAPPLRRPAPASRRSVAVLIGLVRAFRRDAEVFGLLIGQLRQLDAEVGQMKAGYLFIELLREHVNLPLVLALVMPESDLRQHLIRERRRHDERRVSRCASE